MNEIHGTMCRISAFSVVTLSAVAAAVGSEPDAGFDRIEQMRKEWVMLDATGEPVVVPLRVYFNSLIRMFLYETTFASS